MGTLLAINTISHAYYIRYRIKFIIQGRTVYTDTITASDYNYKWKHIVPYSFRENLEEERCRIPAIVEIKREAW